MALDPNVKLFLDTIQAQEPPPPPPREAGVDDARQGIALLHMMCSQADIARAEDRVVPGSSGDVAIRIFSQATEAVLPAVIYFHGGGWTIGDVDCYDTLCRKLAIASGLTVISVDYRLAPEHTF